MMSFPEPQENDEFAEAPRCEVLQTIKVGPDIFAFRVWNRKKVLWTNLGIVDFLFRIKV